MRYVGQYDDITIPVLDAEWKFEAVDLAALLQRFHRTHDTLNGYSSPEQPCEVTALHMSARGLVEKPLPTLVDMLAGSTAPARRRTIWLETGAHEVPVYAMTAMPQGEIIQGPAIVELPGSTLVLRSDFSAGIDGGGNLLAYKSSRPEFAKLLEAAAADASLIR